MEGHISNKYAKFITSRPHAYSENGLENITQLLTMKANNVKLTEEIYYKFKTGESVYKKLNLEKFISELLILGGRTDASNCFASIIILFTLPALSLFRFSMALKKAVL